MDMAAATKNDWLHWPNREDAVLYRQAAPGLCDAHPLAAEGAAPLTLAT